MIADIHRSSAEAGGVVGYVRYCVMQKSGAESGHRLGAVYADGLALGRVPDETDASACESFAERVAIQFEDWTRDHRPNKTMPKSLAVIGSFSYGEKDSGWISDAEAIQKARRSVVEVMGGNRPAIYMVNRDTDCVHVHFLAARVGEDGKIWNKSFDFRDWEMAMERRELEDPRLERVLQRKAVTLEKYAGAKADKNREVRDKPPSAMEINRTLRTGEISPKMALKSALQEAREGAKNDFNRFAEGLDARGVLVKPNIGQNGTVSGLSFTQDGVWIKGSQFGSSYGWKALKEGLHYEQNQHGAVISRWVETAATAGAIGPDRGDGSGAILAPELGDRATSGRAGGFDRDQGSAGDRIGSPGSIGLDPNQFGIGGFNGRRGTDRRTIEQKREPLVGANREHGADTRRASESAERGHKNPTRTDQGHQIAARRVPARAKLPQPIDSVSGRRAGVSGATARVHAITEAAMQLKPQHHARINGFNSLAQYLGVQNWDVRVADRSQAHSRSGSQPISTGDFRQCVVELTKLNNEREQCDVYAAPRDDDHLYIQIDDVPPMAVQVSIEPKYKPCAVLETSRDNWQAIIKIRRTGDDAVDRAACAILTRELNNQFGGDNGAQSSWNKGFRIPGFANRKSYRAGAYTKLIKAHSHAGHVDEHASARFSTIAAEIRLDRLNQAQQTVNRATTDKTPPLDAARVGARLYAREIALAQQLVAAGTWQSVDYSAIDYRVSREMLGLGYTRADAGLAMESHSPGLGADRHIDDGLRYMLKTLDKVDSDLAHVAAVERQAAEQKAAAEAAARVEAEKQARRAQLDEIGRRARELASSPTPFSSSGPSFGRGR